MYLENSSIVVERDIISNDITPKTTRNITTKVDKIKLKGLSRFQKTLLTTDGTVTEMLEHYLDEPISIVKIYEGIEEDINSVPSSNRILVENFDIPVLVRKVTLQGSQSTKNWLYAESSIFIDNLTEEFRSDLINSKMPIGKLWAKHRFETFKSDFSTTKEIADKDLSEHLNVSPGDEILSRTYSVYSMGKRTMVITEKFSSSSFIE